MIAPPDPRLTALAERSLARPADAAARALAARLASRPGAAAVLFYGARLRAPDRPGLIDLYVLTTGDADWHGPGLGALANRLLPPTVLHERPGDLDAAAKVAVIRLDAFRSRMRRDSWDATLWARFAQPAALLEAKDAATAQAVAEAVAEGWRTAAWWADRLPHDGDRWRGLFAATYGAELRPEGAARPGDVAAADPGLRAEIDRLLPPATPTAAETAAARRAWARRRAAGRALNALRLVKAAFTFRGGAAYAISKLERHAGPEALSPWERRAPWAAAPVVLWRLLRGRGRR
ncbi:MAG TPA: hypothetical protein VJ994_03405 [Paracoccaceae bacterium]|nr:hypothetical protein [Paracoccaceae bacterium]